MQTTEATYEGPTLGEVSSRTSLCLCKMNCEAGETESDIERIAGGTAEMPNSHTILGHMRGVFWRFIQTVQQILSLQRSSDQNVEPSWLCLPH